MIIKEEKYCIVRKSFPLQFMQDGDAYDTIQEIVLMDKEYCENELKTYDEPEENQIIKVTVTYEF